MKKKGMIRKGKMHLLNIETSPTLLSIESKPVPPELVSRVKYDLLNPMLTTLSSTAHGLAHVQIDKDGWKDNTDYRAFALRRKNGNIKVFINPVMKIDAENSTSYTHTEECLSIPKWKDTARYGLLSYNILRYPTCLLWDDSNDAKRYHGIEAACIQHEMDHLEGIILSGGGLLLDKDGNVDKSNW